MDYDANDPSTHAVPCACAVCFENQMRETHNALEDEGDCWICQFYESEPELRKSYTRLFDTGRSVDFMTTFRRNSDLRVFK